MYVQNKVGIRPQLVNLKTKSNRWILLLSKRQAQCIFLTQYRQHSQVHFHLLNGLSLEWKVNSSYG